jgi:pimeloyl-ACP methyl ester carboxylesterase
MIRSFLHRHILLSAVIVLRVALCAGAAHAAADRLSIAGLDVTVWRPDGGAPTAAAPIIVFSHGFHGCATQSRFLMTAFASAGYLVVAPNHRDATCNGGEASLISPPEQSFGKPAAWDDATFRDRADDIRRLVAALKADPVWRDRIDWQRLGLVGHSLGGYTVLGLSGAWPDWKLDGVTAVLALSPYVEPFLLRHSLGGLAAPVMYQGGTLDFGITPFVRKPMGAYDQSPAPKYYVELRRAGHLAWTDLNATNHAAIIAYSVAFMDRYLRGTPADRSLTEPTPAVATLRYATEPRP